jgi:hypothetical protein
MGHVQKQEDDIFRDKCAVEAMGAICAHEDTWGKDTVEKIAIEAYNVANAMVEARRADALRRDEDINE